MLITFYLRYLHFNFDSGEIHMMLTRRAFLSRLSYLGAGAVAWGAFPRLGYAAVQDPKVLFINLNGGLDGLSALQPRSGDIYNALSSVRSTLKVAPENLLSADSLYGFHPNIPAFKTLYDAGQLLPILNVGYKNMSRSHLDAEVAVARGVVDRLNPSSNGFLNRLGAHYGWNSLRAVSVTGTDLAFEGGDFRGVQVRGLQDFYFHGFGQNSTEGGHLVDVAYSLSKDGDIPSNQPTQKEVQGNFETAVDNTDLIHSTLQSTSPIYSYPSTQFGRALNDIDVLFSSANLNTQIGYMRCIGFDTHGNQTPTLNKLLTELNASLDIFISNMKARSLWDNLIVMVFSEFGRTNRENGSGGTDHGGANPVFLLGGLVHGGSIVGQISANSIVNEGWLPMQYHIVEVYRRIFERLNIDPNVAFSQPDGPGLSGIFY